MTIGLHEVRTVSMTDVSRCALCGSGTDLRRSHIIPRFTQKRIKKLDGTARRFHLTSHPEGDIVQDYFFERLLCHACEARLQKSEDYAAHVMAEGGAFDFPPLGHRRGLTLRVDYARMKLFLLSVLWRMGASSRPEFKNVELGPHLARIGEMLRKEDPGPAWLYGCIATVIRLDGERMAITLSGDTVRHQHGVRAHRVLIDGVLFAWTVASEDMMRRFHPRGLLLQEDGRWLMTDDDWRNVEYLREQIDQLMRRSS